MQQEIIHNINKLPKILEELNRKKLFLVVGSSFQYLNIKDTITAIEIEKIIFSDFKPNPLYEDVCKGFNLFKAESCDVIMAIGGGSAIDVAKCIKLAALAENGIDAIIPPLVNTRVHIDGNNIPFIAIPTTAGSGSESTHNAVIYYNNSKQTITNDGVLPEYAILEPSVLRTLPLYQKKCTMMDALCQGIESWWSINSTEESYEYSRKAIELIIQNWHSYIFDNDSEAAIQIMLAANYSGRAINITQTTAAHAMSYKITSLYGIPHGYAVASCLPTLWEFMLTNINKCVDSRGSKYLFEIFKQIAKAMGVITPTKAIELFKQMMIEMDLPKPVTINRKEELTILSSSVNPIRLKNNPVELSNEVIYKLYKVIVD